MLGYGPQEMRNLTWADLIPLDDWPAIFSDRAQAATGHKSQFMAERRYRRKDGHWVWGRLTTSLVTDGGDLYTINLIEDITERKKPGKETGPAGHGH